MKLAQNLVAPAIVLGLTLGLAGGCGTKKPPGTNPPGATGGGGDGGGGTASNGGGGDSSDGGGGTEAGNGGGGSADGGGGGVAAGGKCEAKVADTPTLLFNNLVLLRPPVGVEFPMDDNPMFIQASMSGGFMSACDAIIKRVIISIYEADKKRKLAKLLDEFVEQLQAQGYTGGKKSSALVDTATDYHMTVEYGGGGGSEAVTLYLAAARRGEQDFVIVFEAAPEDTKILAPTYEESAKSLFLVPPDA